MTSWEDYISRCDIMSSAWPIPPSHAEGTGSFSLIKQTPSHTRSTQSRAPCHLVMIQLVIRMFHCLLIVLKIPLFFLSSSHPHLLCRLVTQCLTKQTTLFRYFLRARRRYIQETSKEPVVQRWSWFNKNEFESRTKHKTCQECDPFLG
jgi:hypothetical protein